VKAYLKPFSWEMVQAQNSILCAAKSAHHGPSSDGFEETKERWEKERVRMMSLDESIRFLQSCHRSAPFCFYNGNTFASIGLLILRGFYLSAEESVIIRSLAGHIVAGVSTGEEEAAFKAFSDSLEE